MPGQLMESSPPPWPCITASSVYYCGNWISQDYSIMCKKK
jgi:hypothetical protein